MSKHCNCHDVEPMYRQAVEPAVHWMIPPHQFFVPNQPPAPTFGCGPMQMYRCGPRICPPPPMHNPCTYNGYIQAPHPYIYWMHTRKTTVAAGTNVDVSEVVEENGDTTYVVSADPESQKEQIAALQETVAAQSAMISKLSAKIDEINGTALEVPSMTADEVNTIIDEDTDNG